jgi:hypothetical protein
MRATGRAIGHARTSRLPQQICIPVPRLEDSIAEVERTAGSRA